jgi:hypothetical protein
MIVARPERTALERYDRALIVGPALGAVFACRPKGRDYRGKFLLQIDKIGEDSRTHNEIIAVHGGPRRAPPQGAIHFIVDGDRTNRKLGIGLRTKPNKEQHAPNQRPHPPQPRSSRFTAGAHTVVVFALLPPQDAVNRWRVRNLWRS